MNSLKDIGEVLAYWAHIWHDGGHTPFLFWNAVVLGEHLVYECQSDAKAKNQGTKLKHIFYFIYNNKLRHNYHTHQLYSKVGSRTQERTDRRAFGGQFLPR